MRRAPLAQPAAVALALSLLLRLVNAGDYRVVLEVAGNSDAVILSGLEADTQYQVTVAALWGGHKYRSRPIVFRTLGVEIGIVVMVLLVWIGAIALFFNRWGKIRMLLPYQPDYKQEQLKVRSADNIPLTSLCDSSERLCKVKPREETINEEATSKSDDSSSVETVKHFGLPILSVSGPSPPDEDYDQIDEYL
ncbi:hypothetical protein ABMA27_016733 [Loxostege sticticalis]|uniref:Fibronectin type III domain-containing protein n=1 Tax=Loxostege sticticalis TaxID=481309 RepID=A0ABR3I3L8_LOXSC